MDVSVQPEQEVQTFHTDNTVSHSIFSHFSSLPKKAIGAVIVVLVLLVGLYATIIASQHSTEIRQHASGFSPMYVVNGVIDGGPIPYSRILTAQVVEPGCASTQSNAPIPPHSTSFNLTINNANCGSGAVVFTIRNLRTGVIQQAGVSILQTPIPFPTTTPTPLPTVVCTSNAMCPSGTMCKNGECVFNIPTTTPPPPVFGCTNNTMCPSGAVCTNGECNFGIPGGWNPVGQPNYPTGFPVASEECLAFSPGAIIGSKQPGSDVGVLHIIPGEQQNRSCGVGKPTPTPIPPSASPVTISGTLKLSAPQSTPPTISALVPEYPNCPINSVDDSPPGSSFFNLTIPAYCATGGAIELLVDGKPAGISYAKDPNTRVSCIIALPGENFTNVFVDPNTPVDTSCATNVPTPTISGKLPPCGAYGDVDGDGVVTQSDATEILRHITGLPPLKNYIAANADVDGAETVDSVDALDIQRYLAGLPTVNNGITISCTPSFPVCISSLTLPGFCNQNSMCPGGSVCQNSRCVKPPISSCPTPIISSYPTPTVSK